MHGKARSLPNDRGRSGWRLDRSHAMGERCGRGGLLVVAAVVVDGAGHAAVVAQLGLGAQLELTHALAADAELLAERRQRRGARAHVARLDDRPLARVEHLEPIEELL